MRKTILTAFILFFIAFSANAETYKDIFNYANKRTNINFLFGCNGYNTDIALQEFGMSFTTHGIYADLLLWPRKHGSDVRVDKWDDDECLTFHVGYQIPIQKWVRITPIVGYTYNACGTTDGYNYSCGNNGINNKFNADYEYKEFDYGAVLTFNINHVNVSATLTNYNWYVGLGVEF